MNIEKYCAPRSLEEAVELLRAGNVTVLAGGTDLMPQTKAGRMQLQPVLMNLRRVPELRGIAEEGGVVRIGALVTITELRDSALVRGRLELLWQACDHFASDQIRNAATIGGNICNASPAGDTLVPLLALEARVVLAAKPNGKMEKRRVALGDFFTGPGKTVRRPSELLAAVEVLQDRTGRGSRGPDERAGEQFLAGGEPDGMARTAEHASVQDDFDASAAEFLEGIHRQGFADFRQDAIA